MNFGREIAIVWMSGKKTPYRCSAFTLRRAYWVTSLKREAFIDIEYGSKVVVFDLVVVSNSVKG
jgi:hypothetical protein